MGPPLRRPLLYPPPLPPSSRSASPRLSPNTFTFTLRSRLYRSILLLPLIFIYLILFFSFYAYFLSLVSHYLLWRQRSYTRGLTEGALFLWLWLGCAGSVGMAYWRGGGVVKGVKKMRGREDGEDDEETVGLFSGRFSGSEGGTVGGGDSGLPSPEEEGSDEEDVGAGGLAADIGLEESRGLLISPGTKLKRKMSSVKLEARSPRAKGVKGGPAGGVGWDLNSALRELDGGEVPSSAEMRRRLDGKVMVKRNGGVRFCRKCIVEKADRAHHCSSCNACVLKMDHHCPWLGGGCVGWANYKFFLLFLWYGGALGFYVGITMLFELMRFVDAQPENSELTPISWALIMILGFVFGFSLTCFGLYHLYLAMSNRTTLEAMESSPTFLLPPLPDSLSQFSTLPPLSTWEKRKLERKARKINVYDVGWKQNLVQIFGPRWWMWGVPGGWPPGDGTTFPLNSDNLMKLSEISARLWASAEAEAGRGGGDEGMTTTEGSGGSSTGEWEGSESER